MHRHEFFFQYAKEIETVIHDLNNVIFFIIQCNFFLINGRTKLGIEKQN
jgi:hypothetical protein